MVEIGPKFYSPPLTDRGTTPRAITLTVSRMRRSLYCISLVTAASLICSSVASAQRTVVRPPPGRTRTPATTPAPAPAPAPTPAGGGTYRVTLTGFRVNHETYDTALETDGKGDEIRVMATVEEIGPDGRATAAPRTLQTPVYGDINNFPKRIQAGSRSSKGGLRTGDEVPATGSALLQGSPLQDRIPMLLWQGTLHQGGGGVAIAPVVWEIDEGDVLTAPFSGAVSVIHAIAGVTSLIGGPAGAIANVVVQSADRPIGVIHAKVGGIDELHFTPQVVTLTAATAEAALAGKGGAVAPGLIEVRYRDPSADLKGDYSVFLRVDRMP